MILDKPFTEKDAMLEILRWSQNRPNWQRDALRRIVQYGSLGAKDIEQLTNLCVDSSLPHAPLSEAHISGRASEEASISLKGISRPVNVNALAPGQSISFQREGMTIVYGDNGSGKSGYVRILKYACRSRDKNQKILRDIESRSDEPQSADIEFFCGSDERSWGWTPDSPSHSELPFVSIFDSRSASTHVEKTNELAYSPLPMQVLEALRDACDLIAEEVNKKIKSINTQTPDALLNPKINANTVGGKFINGLSEKSDIAKLEALINLTPDDEAEMKSLAADLEGDSAKAIAKLSAVKVAFGQEAKKLKELVEVTSEEKVQELASAREDHTKKVEIAKTASDRLFSAAPLPNIGSELWRELWEAARRYSDHAAYPDKTFPEATADHDLCVLCQQPLSEEAVERRNTFEQFVKGETKAAEAKAKRRAEDALRSIESKQQNHDFVRELTRIIGLELDDPELSMSMRRAAVVARWRLRAIRRGHVPRLPSVPFPAENAKVTWEKLTRRIEQLKGDEASPQRKEMRARLEDLRSRKYLKNFESDIRLEIERRRRIAALKESGKTAAKRAVTELNKSLSDKLVTDALRGRFAREVQKLDIGCMPLELQKSDRNAVSLFRVCFVERPKEPVGDVLSEGEHRCVALAAFLAELVTSREYSGIVFDDPMSSLDHLHRRSVARRLVEEAEHRQVVVFTHDLAFMFELKREAEAQGQSVHYQHVHRRQKQPGHVKGDLPLKAKPGLELANAIRGELKAVKSEFDSFPEARRSIMAKGFIEQIREGWDQGVADFIMPVLGRFDNRIATGSIFKLAVLNDVDVSTVIAARKRLSEELHLYSEALNPSDVSHAGLVAEVAALEDWLRDMKERQGKASLPARSSA